MSVINAAIINIRSLFADRFLSAFTFDWYIIYLFKQTAFWKTMKNFILKRITGTTH